MDLWSPEIAATILLRKNRVRLLKRSSRADENTLCTAGLLQLTKWGQTSILLQNCWHSFAEKNWRVTRVVTFICVWPNFVLAEYARGAAKLGDARR